MQRRVRVIPWLAGRRPTPSYILQDLERRTGLKRRTLQVWGDSGILVPDVETLHGGRGTPRHYSVTELIMAVLLAPFAKAGFTIGYLARIADILRQALDVHQAGSVPAMFEKGTLELGHALVRALHGQGRNFLFLATNEAATDEERRIFIVPATDEEGPIAFDPLELDPEGTSELPRFGFWIDLAVIAGLLKP
jgi:hypothetical protein